MMETAVSIKEKKMEKHSNLERLAKNGCSGRVKFNEKKREKVWAKAGKKALSAVLHFCSLRLT